MIRSEISSISESVLSGLNDRFSTQEKPFDNRSTGADCIATLLDNNISETEEEIPYVGESQLLFFSKGCVY